MVTRREFPLFVRLFADDRLSPVLQRVQLRLARFGPGITSSLGLESIGARYQALSGHLGDVRSRFLSLATSITAVTLAAGAAGTALLTSFADAGEEIDATATRLDLTTDRVQELGFVVERLGIGQSALDSGLGAFTRNLGQLRAGFGPLLSMLARVDAGFVQSMEATSSTDEALLLFLDRLSLVPDKSARAALAASAFGKAGGELVLLVKDGMDPLLKEMGRAHELGAIMNAEMIAESLRLDAELDDLRSRLLRVRNTILLAISPAVRSVLDRLGKYLDENKDRIRAWAEEFAEKLPGRIDRFLELLDKGITAIGGVGNALLVLAGILSAPFVNALVQTTVSLALATRALVSFSAAILTNPIGLLATAILGVSVAIVVFAKKLYDLGVSVQDVWLMIRIAFASGVDWIETQVRRLVGVMPDWLVELLRAGAPQFFRSGQFSFNTSSDAGTPAGGRAAVLAAELVKRGPAIQARAETRRDERSRILLEFLGLPDGVNVRTDPRSDADIETKLGPALGGP